MKQSITQAQYSVVGLGELLWDLLPGGKQLGGAPTNFAYIAGCLGDDAIVASRVGEDELGAEALARLAQLGLPASFVQRDETHPTGTVLVDINESGEPTYTSSPDTAWDHLVWTPQWKELATRADAVCFGTLAQRSTESRAAIQKFLQETRPAAMRIFDVNLRHSFATLELITESLELSTAVKLNSAELPRVAAMLQLGGRGERAIAHRLIQVFGLELVAITRGAEGSLLVTEEECVEHQGYQVKVVDTIGAGDAFAATVVHYYLRGATLERISEAANRIGSWIATQTGATPPIDAQMLRAI
jgi:fructokinase